jgi:hypothetical protein
MWLTSWIEGATRRYPCPSPPDRFRCELGTRQVGVPQFRAARQAEALSDIASKREWWLSSRARRIAC